MFLDFYFSTTMPNLFMCGIVVVFTITHEIETFCRLYTISEKGNSYIHKDIQVLHKSLRVHNKVASR